MLFILNFRKDTQHSEQDPKKKKEKKSNEVSLTLIRFLIPQK